jgi:hypothetical protein
MTGLIQFVSLTIPATIPLSHLFMCEYNFKLIAKSMPFNGKAS